MNAEHRTLTVVTHLHCLECKREWLDPNERWRLYVLFDDEPEQGLYCPLCASFEFDA